MKSAILQAAAITVVAVALLLSGTESMFSATAADIGLEAATGGELSRVCRAGIWVIGQPHLLLVGAGLMWLGC